MNKLVLIGTKHQEDGLINSNELLKIIDKINPTVVFEEIPPSFHDLYYRSKERSNLESKAIINYLVHHTVKQIPVDYYNIPNSFFENTGKVHEIVERRSYTYRDLIDHNKRMAAKNGFKYLNSEDYERIEYEINTEILDVVKLINDKRYSEYWNTWLEIEQIRENKMLDTIYEYSMVNQYDIGVFFIGAGHRKSIISKIKNRSIIKNDSMKWEYNNYNNLLE
jgi:hypothetical protein